MTKMRYPKGTAVEFTVNDLGASERNDLGHVVSEKFGVGDRGLVSFPHPNPAAAAIGWCYVEVESKNNPGQRLYVGVREKMYAKARS